MQKSPFSVLRSPFSVLCSLFPVLCLLFFACSEHKSNPSGPAPVQTEGMVNMYISSYCYNFHLGLQVHRYFQDSTGSFTSAPDSIDLIFFPSSSSPPDIAANPIYNETWGLTVEYLSENVQLIDNGSINLLDDITEVPETGYYYIHQNIEENEIFAVQLKDSTYALVQIIDIDGSNVTFSWKYRPDGSRFFF